MQYTVVHSKDPYLLARLATDLQMSGYNEDDLNFNHHPFQKGFYWMDINSNVSPIGSFEFHCTPLKYYGNSCELTSRNYIKVLTQILS